ncbi:serpin family protein [Pseudogracilibacillus sp. SO30301A]|uniref:serpin family protein n=1 Tax=Pseudogracilibacillus sp. SO30301A TaxID=3098291 RepID=UPI00300E2B0B
MKQAKLFISLFMLLLAVGCGNGKESEEREGHAVSGSVEDYEQLVEPNNILGFSLLDKMDPDENGNIFISPTSALMALLIAYNGAEAKTKAEMEEVLELNGLTVDEINKANRALVDMLTKDSEGFELSIANSIWLNEEYHFTGAFEKKAIDYFDAEIFEINVFDTTSVDQINNWVNDSTDGKIEEIIEAPLHPDMVTLLINALYFNGKWTYEFDEGNTKTSTFFSPEREMDVPFMVLEEELEYVENETFQAVKLPYGKGEMNMQVILPNEGVSLGEVAKEMNSESWKELQTQFKETNGMIKLPKFQVEYETILNESLQQLGMISAFDNKEADFSQMIEENAPLWIHKVKQKTFINVNEEGSEAAAATSVEMRTTSAIIGDDFYMDVNRPFLFTISMEESNVNLFIGLISSPEQV